MRKIVSMVVASVTLFFFSLTSLQAEMRAGIAGSVGLFEASGSELEGGTGGETNTATDAAKFAYPSIFVEFNTGPVVLGLDFIPSSVESDEASRTDINIGDSQLTTGNDGGASGVTNTAKVAIDQHITLYGLLPIMDTGAYLRAGISRMNVETKEALGTGSSYTDKTGVQGVHGGLGYQHDTDGGVFLRAELFYSKYDNVKLTGTGGHIVDVDLEGGGAKISIGRAF